MSDSEDDVPLALRVKQEENGNTGKENGESKREASVKSEESEGQQGGESEDQEDEESNEDESRSEDGDDDDSDEDIPLSQRRKKSATPSRGRNDDEDDDEDVPLSQRKKSAPVGQKRGRPKEKANQNAKRQKKPNVERSSSRAKAKDQATICWQSLKHAGVLFPPEYQPHGVKLLYDGKPVDLTPEQEEVASMFAVMKETDYMKKPQFLKNFWDGFKEVLGPKHPIKCLEKCDFTAMYEYFMAEREKKKQVSKEEKEAMKKEKEASEAKYRVAYVDGRPEPVGNFRVEPPGLFRGRGEHPKMGMIKKRVYPKDIVINIGEGEPIPQHPYPGQKWKEVRHDHTVTWLAYWKDTINTRDFKYVFLGATSTFKADADWQKYEKARKLKHIIGRVRDNYQRDLVSKEFRTRQMATALYFIDVLALRAGHEKEEDEAETAGCCTLKVEHLELIPPNKLRFDFLGKDSIRYENTCAVEARVFKNMEEFTRFDSSRKKKKPSDQVFDTFDANDLNRVLRDIMEGLTVKVFRTYNASVVLERLLTEVEAHAGASIVEEKKADYDRANKEVAILCNHQRSVAKTHGNQMEKLTARLQQLESEQAELESELKDAQKGKNSKNPDTVASRLEKKKLQLEKAKLQMNVKEDLKTVSLGTSKINYMDPRITVAWAKRIECPIEKLFNKSLLGKFNWSMEVEPDYVF